MKNENEWIEEFKDDEIKAMIPLTNPDCILTALLYEWSC